jgi:hypothetical protein
MEKAELEKLYEDLSASFPQDAYSKDSSRGVTLIGVKGAWVVDRLNNVFGLIGHGWRYAHNEPYARVHEKASGGSLSEVVVSLRLQWRVGEGGIGPVEWHSIDDGFFEINRQAPPIWSEPISSTGGNLLRGGGSPFSDAAKGAITDALSKAASKIGVGIQAYKGLLELDGQRVGVKGEETERVAFSEMKSVANTALGTLLRFAPDGFEQLRDTNEYTQGYFASQVLNPLARDIEDSGLSPFVKEHFRRILHTDEIENFAQMTAIEAGFMSDVLEAVVNQSITADEALEVCDMWDNTTPFADLYNKWKAIRAEEE